MNIKDFMKENDIYFRLRDEEGRKEIILSKSGFEKFIKNLSDSEKKKISEIEEDSLYSMKNGKNEIFIRKEIQIHNEKNNSWKIISKKMEDGLIIKINGYKSGFFQIWINPIIDNKRKWKSISKSSSEKKIKEIYNSLIKDYENQENLLKKIG